MGLEYATASRDDDDKIGALCEKCLHTPAEYFITRLRADPTVGPNARLVARDGSVIASNVNYYSFKLAFGSAEVGAGAIANVSTDPAYRGRGAATRLMEEAHRRMLAEGLPLAILGTGIHPFYERLGYAVWERAETRLLALQVPAARASARKIDLKRDLRDLLEMKAAAREEHVGGLVRDEALWNAQTAWNRWFPAEDPDLALLGHGGRAFLRMGLESGGESAAVFDFGVRPGQPGAVKSLANAAAGELAARGVKAVRLPAPCRELADAFGEHAKAREPQANRSYMVKVLNLQGFLAALAPELARRAAAARITTGQVGVKHGSEELTLVVRQGGIAIENGVGAATPFVSLDPANWIEVFMGVKRFSSQPFARRSRAGEKEINLLEALFPKRESLFWEADNF